MLVLSLLLLCLAEEAQLSVVMFLKHFRLECFFSTSLNGNPTLIYPTPGNLLSVTSFVLFSEEILPIG